MKKILLALFMLGGLATVAVATLGIRTLSDYAISVYHLPSAIVYSIGILSVMFIICCIVAKMLSVWGHMIPKEKITKRHFS